MPQLNTSSTVELNNGVRIPRLGLGVWKVPDGEAVRNAVVWALQTGYRHIDTARIYRNETGVGQGIAQSGIPREEIFVTSKLWNADQGHASALQAVEATLARLGLAYLDLYLIHWPYTSELKWRNKRRETWAAMEQIQRAGKARSIGVSNYTIEHLEEMKSYAAIPPAVNQVEMHPFLYQKELADYCTAHHIQIEAYSPLAHGKRVASEKIAKLAEKYSKSNAQILIRWSLQHGFVVLPKSVHQDRIEENFQVFDFELRPEDMAYVDSLHENFRTCWDPT